MDKRIVTLDENIPVIEAIRAMVKGSVWSVVVTRSGIPIGLMTDRDFIRKCFLPEHDPKKTPIGELASCPLITIDPDASLGTALQVMVQKQVRRLIVVEGGKVIGRLTHTDVLEKTLDTFQTLASISHQML